MRMSDWSSDVCSSDLPSKKKNGTTSPGASAETTASASAIGSFTASTVTVNSSMNPTELFDRLKERCALKRRVPSSQSKETLAWASRPLAELLKTPYHRPGCPIN